MYTIFILIIVELMYFSMSIFLLCPSLLNVNVVLTVTNDIRGRRKMIRVLLDVSNN